MLRSGTLEDVASFQIGSPLALTAFPALITFLDAYDLLFKGAKNRNLVLEVVDDWWNRAEAK